MAVMSLLIVHDSIPVQIPKQGREWQGGRQAQEICPGAWGRDAGTKSGRGHGGQQVCLDDSVLLEFSLWALGSCHLVCLI